MKTKVIAKAVLVRPDGRVLVMRRSADDEVDPGEWDFPGGGVDPGEEPVAGVAREILEEAGLHLKPESLTLIYGYTEAQNDKNKVRLFYTGHTSDDHITLSHEHDHYEWMELAEAIQTSDNSLHKIVLEHVQNNHLLTATA